MVSFGVHALLESVVVPPLQAVGRTLGRARAGASTQQQARARPGSRAAAAGNRATRGGADQRAHDRTPGHAVGGGLIGSGASDLAMRIVAAIEVIGTELFETPTLARKNHHARSGRNAHATCQHDRRNQRKTSQRIFHSRRPLNAMAA